ncbi:MAG: hypothetical protein ETSY2_38915 [Candidatus Entotheonella gemina]|uniref:histidine kinase n=1 Tax=Candidatus Entotheonella gemina TaxID=1429439 RepID=W4LSU8_9BACT|nr:MAG: hypothetical protein ETSY2_38915 [Candidatus Entotheonella gemina]
MASERQLKLEFLTAEATPEVILDPDKIRQVCRNLLSNAVKFSPESGAIICRLHEQHQAGTVLLTISDEGIGIPEDELETIFDRFVQSSKTRTGAGGTGLGLAICQGIVAAHNGRIWAQIRPAGGAIFAIELPIHQTHLTHVVGHDS